MNYFDSTQNNGMEELVDSSFLCCLVEMLKTPDPPLQRKAASVLEFVVATEPCAEKLRSANIASGLEAVFQQKCLIGMELQVHASCNFCKYVIVFFPCTFYSRGGEW